MERPLTLQWSPVNQDNVKAKKSPPDVAATNRSTPDRQAVTRITDLRKDEASLSSASASTNPSDDEGRATSRSVSTSQSTSRRVSDVTGPRDPKFAEGRSASHGVEDADLTEDDEDIKDGGKKKKWTKLTDDDYILVIQLCCSYGDLYGKVSDKAFYQAIRKEYGDITGKRPPGARAIQYRLNKLTTDWLRIFGEDENARHMNRIEMAVREWVFIVQARSEKDKKERETAELLLQKKNERQGKEQLGSDQLDVKRIRSQDDAPESKRLKMADEANDLNVPTRTRSHGSARSADDIKHLREYFDAKIDRIMNLLEDLAKRIG